MCDRVTLEPEPPDTGARVRESVNSYTACRVWNKSEYFARPGSRGLRPGGLHTRTLGRPVTETGGDGIINTEDEVRPIPIPVTETQYAVCCVGADRETGRSIPHLTIGSEQAPGACGHPMSHTFTIHHQESKYFKLRLTKIVNNTTEHLNLRHSEFVLNRQTHILSYTLSSCPGLKTKRCRCVAKPHTHLIHAWELNLSQ